MTKVLNVSVRSNQETGTTQGKFNIKKLTSEKSLSSKRSKWDLWRTKHGEQLLCLGLTESLETHLEKGPPTGPRKGAAVDPTEKFTAVLPPELDNSWQAAVHRGAGVTHWRWARWGLPFAAGSWEQELHTGTRKRAPRPFSHYAVRYPSCPLLTRLSTVPAGKRLLYVQGPAPGSQSRANDDRFGAERQYVDNCTLMT